MKKSRSADNHSRKLGLKLLLCEGFIDVWSEMCAWICTWDMRKSTSLKMNQPCAHRLYIVFMRVTGLRVTQLHIYTMTDSFEPSFTFWLSAPNHLDVAKVTLLSIYKAFQLSRVVWGEGGGWINGIQLHFFSSFGWLWLILGCDIYSNI